MRFSLQLLLAAMAYASLVVATFVSGSSVLSGLAWIVAAIACCYAAVTLCYARGKRQAVALGFVLLSAAHFAVVCYFPARTPASLFFSGIGYVAVEQGYLYTRSDPPIVQLFSPAKIGSDRMIINGQAVLSAANATGTILAGLVGCGIGALAYRRSTAA
jgi:hypothetical protein